MKPRLGDDASDGWLLLGGPGSASADDSADDAVRANAGAGLAVRSGVTAVAAAAALSAHSPSSPGGGSSTNPRAPVNQR